MATATQNGLDLATMLHILLDDRDVGAYVLTKGDQSDRFRFVFGFDCQGIHPTLLPDQVNRIFNNLEVGLKNLPPDEQITFHLGSFSSEQERQEQLKALIEGAPSPEVQFLLMAERARIQELTQQGVRKPKFLRIYVTYTIQPSTVGTETWMQKLKTKGKAWWYTFTGEAAERYQRQLQNMFESAYKDGLLKWEQIISQQLGLEIDPLNPQQLWSAIWNRFHTTQPPPIPQKLVLDQEGLHEQNNSELHSTTLLLESELTVAESQVNAKGSDRQPKSYRQSVIEVKGRKVGVLTFLHKPGNWQGQDKLIQLRYLWELLAQQTVIDTEIFCQLSGVNSTQENSPQVHGGIAILVHRSTPKQLDHACQYIENWFQRPAWVIREKEYAGRIWLQTLPIVWERLLETPFNRCQKYLTSEVPGVIPLVMTKAIDSQGFELIADEGGTPIDLDLFNQYKNLAILGRTGAGKSVLVCGIFTQALALGIPIVALDYPKPDGSFTFTDYANFFKGNSAYWDISQVSRNLSGLPRDAQLLFFALGNSSEVQDAAVCAAIRQALSHQASTFKDQAPILFIDEAPNLLEFEQMAELVSRLCDKRNARRVRVILSAQEPAAIANSKVTTKIFQNFPTRLIGKIQKGAIDSFEHIWKYPGGIISRNASESFLPNRESFYSQWLLDDNGSYTFCRYYPAYEQLAVVANNPNEQAKRNQIMKEYVDKYEGLSVLARELVGKVSGV